jgi:hypothetical protein
MQVIRGRVDKFLYGHAGEINGFVLHRGIEVRYPLGQSSRVTAIAAIGSHVEVHGWTHPGPAGGMHLDAAAIMNSKLKRLVYLETPPPPPAPEVPSLSHSAPGEAVPLAPPQLDGAAANATSGRLRGSRTEIVEDGWMRVRLDARQTPGDPNGHGPAAGSPNAGGDQEGAAEGIERAYASLHRVQALLAYIKILNINGPDAGQLLDEAKHSYEQALSNYQRHDFSVARELAAASNDLSRAVEIVISRTLRASANSPTLVPPPPTHPKTSKELSRARDQIAQVEQLLFRLRWLLENGTMPSEEAEQVQKITSWSETFYVEAQQLIRNGATEDALQVAQAADAMAHSAEHVCKQSYVTHGSASGETIKSQASYR